MITVTSEPPSWPGGLDPKPYPVPVSDCLQWCLQPDGADIVTTAGANASIVVTFPTTIGSIPADGTEFVLWGYTFTIDSTTAYTSTSFRVVSSGSITGANFRAMLRANLNISRFAQAIVNPDLFALRSTLLEWYGCAEQPRFSGDNMDLAAIDAIAETASVVTNGITPVYVDGYKIITRLMKYGSDTGFVAVTEYEGFLPQLTCDGSNAMCLDMMRAAKRLLYSPMPDLTETSEIPPETSTLTGLFALEYGWVYRDENCQPQSGTVMQSNQVFVLNAAFEIEQAYGTAPFYFIHPDFGGPGFTKQQFLTNQPQGSRLVSQDSFCWLWWLNGYTDDYPDLDHFTVVITANGKDGSSDVVGLDYPAPQWFEVTNANISPVRVSTLTGIALEDLKDYYVEVQLRDAADAPISVGGSVIAMDSGSYLMSDCIGVETDVYFVTPPGGVATMLVNVEEKEAVQSGTEICLDTPCTTSVEDIAKYGGRTLANLRNYERVTVSAVEIYTDAQVEFFRSFKLSPERWIRVKKKTYSKADVQWMAKKFIVDQGGVRIFQDGNRIELIATGYMADIPVQTPNLVK